jgi:hypothetical protein
MSEGPGDGLAGFEKKHGLPVRAEPGTPLAEAALRGLLQ